MKARQRLRGFTDGRDFSLVLQGGNNAPETGGDEGGLHDLCSFVRGQKPKTEEA